MNDGINAHGPASGKDWTGDSGEQADGPVEAGSQLYNQSDTVRRALELNAGAIEGGAGMIMQFGLGFGQDQTVHTMTEYAQLAEELGFHHLTAIDMNNLSQEVNVMMTVAAMGTSRIHIGHGVTNPDTYHPGAIANAVASLRDLTDGRAFVGIGAGGPYGQLLNKGVLMRELRESLQFIRDYSSGGEGTWKGDSWHNEWIRASRWNGEPVPIYVAVAGPRTCEIAGEFGDAVLSIGMDPELQKWRMEQVAEGAEKAGRDPAEIDVWIRTQCYITESKAAAKRELEPYAATCTWELMQILKRQHPATMDLQKRIERRHPGIPASSTSSGKSSTPTTPIGPNASAAPRPSS